MNLEKTHREVSKSIASLNFARIWPGFEPLRFALYDRNTCFFDGRYIEKTDDFCANTSIVYRGEQIAIWMLEEELPIPVLTSKLVHEMFHGYQNLRGWDCWPDEMEALYRYEYGAENLSLKLRENELLLSLFERFDEVSFRELLSHRKRRMERHPYEFSYESRVEEIEGTAEFVERQVLLQLDEQAAEALTNRMRTTLTKAECLFPIRIPSYDTGALLVSALLAAGVYSFEPDARPAILPILKDVKPSDGGFPGRERRERAVSEAIAGFNEKAESAVRSALEKNEVVLTGPAELVFVNVYNAGRWREYLTSTCFLMLRDREGERMIPGNFVIRMADEKTIDAVYRWD